MNRFKVDAEIRRMDNKNLILTLDNREFKINTLDIRRLISEAQEAVQVKEIKPLDQEQRLISVLGVA